MPLVEYFALLDLLLTIFIVSHDYSSLHISVFRISFCLCLIIFHVLMMCAHDLCHICIIIQTRRKYQDILFTVLIKTKFSLFFQIIFSFGAQPLVLSKLVPHLYVLFGDSNSQVNFIYIQVLTDFFGYTFFASALTPFQKEKQEQVQGVVKSGFHIIFFLLKSTKVSF